MRGGIITAYAGASRSHLLTALPTVLLLHRVPLVLPTAAGQTKPVSVYRLITQGSVEEKIVERALLKLKMDAVVVQSGRLTGAAAAAAAGGAGTGGKDGKAGGVAGPGNKLSKEEVTEMVRFGADAVFRSTGAYGGKDGSSSSSFSSSDGAAGDDPNAMITDADIDTILATGAERTKALQENVNSKLTAMGMASSGGGLLDFKLDGGMGAGASSGGAGVQTFEGVDYRNAKAKADAEREENERLKALRLTIVNASAEAMGDRQAKKAAIPSIEADAAALVTATGGTGKPRAPASDESKARTYVTAVNKLPARMDPWHFVDVARVKAITDMEVATQAALWAQQRAANAASAAASAALAAAASDPAAAAALPSPAAAAAAAAAEVAVPPFGEHLLHERSMLLSQGFLAWRKDDWEAFVDASAR